MFLGKLDSLEKVKEVYLKEKMMGQEEVQKELGQL